MSVDFELLSSQLGERIEMVERNHRLTEACLVKAKEVVASCKIANTVGNSANIVSTGLLWCPPALIFGIGGVVLGSLTSLGTGITESIILSKIGSAVTRIMTNQVHLMEEIETILEAILHTLHAGLHATAHVLEFVAHNRNAIFKVGETAAIGYNAAKVVKVTESAVTDGTQLGIKGGQVAKGGFKAGVTAGAKTTVTISTKAMFAFGAVFSAADIIFTWATDNSFITQLETHLENSRQQLELLRDHQRTVLAAKENNV